MIEESEGGKTEGNLTVHNPTVSYNVAFQLVTEKAQLLSNYMRQACQP